MKIEKLNTNKITSKGVLIGFIVCLIFVIIVSLFTSKAKYQNTQSIKIVEGKVNYILPDLNVVAAYQKDDQGTYQKIEDIPKSGYILNKSDSYCTMPNDDTPIKTMLEFKDGKLTVDITKKGTKCYLYFEEKPIKNAQELLADLKLKSNGSKTSFTAPSTSTEKGIWEADDNDGKSYYFRGIVENNYVKFTGFTWRIIRINGDGSIRLIYDGTTPHKCGETSNDRQIGTMAYNSTRTDNMYLGFRYESGKKQGSKDPSTILGADTSPATGTLNKWYEDNIKGTAAEDHIDKNAIFCNDRRSSATATTFANRNNNGGTGTDTTYYGAYLRILPNGNWGSSQEATLSCESADQFSAKGASKGNGTLVYPIGLITADEVLLAGGFGNKANYKYYLYTGSNYWTMSPYNFNSSDAFMFHVSVAGYLNYSVSNSYLGVRPVINLKADTTFSNGNGSFEHPFEVA